MEPLHLMRAGIQSELQSSFTESKTNHYLLEEDCSLEEGSEGLAKSTLYGNNCKGPLCDPYQPQRRLQI